MNRWLVVAAISLAGPAAFAAQEPELPNSRFEALPLIERNLAVYDAFWANIENNHFDRQLLSRTEVRTLREQGRMKAAAVDHPANLYHQVLSDLSRQLDQSNVEVEPPQFLDKSAHDKQSRMARIKSQEHQEQLAALLLGG